MHAIIIAVDSVITPRHTLMIKSLKSRGWIVTFIGWDRTGDHFISEDYKGLVDEFHLVRLPASSWSRKVFAKLPQYYYKLWQIMSISKEPDLIIFTHIALLPIAYRFSCKKIYDCFEMFSLNMASYFGSLAKLVWPLWLKLEALLVKQVDGVITVDSHRGWLESFFKHCNSQVQAIWNLPSRSEDPETSEVEGLKETYHNRQVIAFVGTLFKEHGLWVALEAAALVKESCPNCLFLFIGSMQDDINLLNSIITSRQIERQVLFLPFMRYQKMQAHLRHAQVGLILYQPEWNNPYAGPGNGRKSFTYMQAEIPIIAPDFGDLGSIIAREHCGILVDITKPTEVAKGIMHLLENPQEAKAMGQRGREAFLSRYNWDLEESKFLQFIRKIMKD